MNKKLLALTVFGTLFFALMAVAAAAADNVSGTWKLAAGGGRGGRGGAGRGGAARGGAARVGQQGPVDRSLVLKADGSNLTGKMVNKRGENAAREFPIENAKIDGDQISFQVKQGGRGAGAAATVVTYKAKVTGDKMEGTQQPEGGNARPFTATKEK